MSSILMSRGLRAPDSDATSRTGMRWCGGAVAWCVWWLLAAGGGFGVGVGVLGVGNQGTKSGRNVGARVAQNPRNSKTPMRR